MNEIVRFQKKGPFPRLWLLLFLIFNILIPAVADAKTPSDKLRVFVQPVSGRLVQGIWKLPEEAYVRQQYGTIRRILMQTGIYEVVPEREVRAVLNGETFTGWQWKRGDWQLAKQTGRRVGADYAMIAERGLEGFYYWQLTLINITTGKLFEERDNHPVGILDHKNNHKQIQESYRRLFREAKGDMMTTALRKGKAGWTSPPAPASSPSPRAEPIIALPSLPETFVAPPPPARPEPPASARPPAPASAPSSTTVLVSSPPSLPETSVAPPPPARPAPPASAKVVPPSPPPEKPMKASERPGVMEERRLAPAETPRKAAAERTRLIVYDFDTVADLRVAGLILAEALRQELHQSGRFVLINREDMVKALEEHKLQWAGIVNEEGSAELGKWLEAGEIVTGKLGRLGGASVLQTKRTDLQTMGTRAIESLKCPSGKEEELLDGMPELVRRLVAAR
jgi:hypothetical protein